MTIEAMKQALEALGKCRYRSLADEIVDPAITALRTAIAEAEKQEPPVQFKCTVVDDQHPNGVPLSQWGTTPAAQRQPQYNKMEMNCFVQNLYDEKMREGKHGHYETMFHVVHRAIEAAHGIGENT